MRSGDAIEVAGFDSYEVAIFIASIEANTEIIVIWKNGRVQVAL